MVIWGLLCVFKRPSASAHHTAPPHLHTKASLGFTWSKSELRSNMSSIIRTILLLALAVCVCQAQRECFHRCSAVCVYSIVLMISLSLFLSSAQHRKLHLSTGQTQTSWVPLANQGHSDLPWDPLLSPSGDSVSLYLNLNEPWQQHHQHVSFSKLLREALTEITSDPSQSHHEERAALLPGPQQEGVQNPEQLNVSGYQSTLLSPPPPHHSTGVNPSVHLCVPGGNKEIRHELMSLLTAAAWCRKTSDQEEHFKYQIRNLFRFIFLIYAI